MLKKLSGTALVTLMAISSNANGQDTSSTKKALTPSAAVMLVSLEDVCIAKASADKKSIQIAKPKFQMETRTMVVEKTIYQTETRSRTVKRNGKDVEEMYTVSVPVTVAEEVTKTVKIPSSGTAKATVPLDRVTGWGLAGNSIAPADLLENLSSTRHVFVLERDITSPLEAMDPFYRSVLDPEAIILVVTPNTFPAQGTAAPSVTSTPAPAPVPPPAPKQD